MPAAIVPVGVYENGTVLQVTVVCDAMIPAGFTVTVTVNGTSVHVLGVPPLGLVGVTRYVAVAATDRLLERLPVTMLLPVPVAPFPMPVPVGTDHAYVVPEMTVPVGVYEKATLLHVVVPCTGVSTDIGYTVIVTVVVWLEQPFALATTE